MRVCLVEDEKFRMDNQSFRVYSNTFTTHTITGRIKMPELTEEKKTAIRHKIHDQLPRDDFHSRKAVDQVLASKIQKREWLFKLVVHMKNDIAWSGPPDRNRDEKLHCDLKLELRDVDLCSPGQRYTKANIKTIPAKIQVLLKLKNNGYDYDYHPIFFNGMARKIFEDGCGGYVQKETNIFIDRNARKGTPTMAVPDKIRVYGMFENVEPMVDYGSHRIPLDLAESNWKIFLDQYRTDVTILAKNGELLDCHRSHFTRNSRVLFKQISDLHQKSAVVNLQDLTRSQVEAFLKFQYSGSTDKILESPLTSLEILKAAEKYEIWNMWNDTVTGLLEKHSKWFRQHTPKFIEFLEMCSKRGDKAIQGLVRQLLDPMSRETPAGCNTETPVMDGDGRPQLRPARSDDGRSEELSQVLETPENALGLQNSLVLEGQLEEDLPNTSMIMDAKRRKRSRKPQDQVSAAEDANPTVGTSQKTPPITSLRRSVRLERSDKKQKHVQPRGLQTDESWIKALKHDTERKKKATKRKKVTHGPRDIWKDPVLPKVAIIPDPMVKVEKVEIADGNEDSSEVAAAPIHMQVVEPMDAGAVNEDEPTPTDKFSVNRDDGPEYGIRKIDIEESD